MQPAPVPTADRLRRIASVRSGRPLREMSDPVGAAASLARTATPPVTDPALVQALTDVLAGRVDALPAPAAAALDLPRDALDPAVDFARAEDRMLGAFLSERGVVDVRSCRGGRGRTALLELLGLVDRAATGGA